MNNKIQGSGENTVIKVALVKLTKVMNCSLKIQEIVIELEFAAQKYERKENQNIFK